MVTGALAGAGYFQGDALHAPRASNPKGFFEAPAINGLNEDLLAPMLADPDLLAGQRWLGVPRPGAVPVATAEQRARMARLAAREPFCFKDPRFSFTLPAWRAALPSGTGFVCAFRHPALTAESLVRECQRAEYLSNVRFDLERAFALWSATYRAILEELAREDDWLFVHYDQMLAPGGRQRLGRFLGASVSAAFPDPKLRRGAPEVQAPAEALALYAELCERAEHRPGRAPDRHPGAEAHVLVLAWIGPGDEAAVPDLVADIEEQRGVCAELLLIDATETGLAQVPPGVRVERGTWSRSADLRRVALSAGADTIALAVPGTRALPARLAHALARLEATGADLVTADYVLTGSQATFVERVSPAAMGDVPGPFFEAGIVARRKALTELTEEAFFPGELALWRSLRAAGRTAHELEPAFSVPRARYTEAWERAQEDALLASLAKRAATGAPPKLTVSLCTYNRKSVLRQCLERLARQRLAPGTFEIVLVDDGSVDGTEAALAGLKLPVPLRALRQANGGLSAARNAGLAEARGALVLFINDDTLAAPDLVERHLERHAAHAGEEVAVLGTFEQPEAALGNALLRYLEGSTEIFSYCQLGRGERYDGFRFWTCNVSVALAAVRAAGGFDESFRHYGCEDTDLGFRLGARGIPVVYEPGARAWHLHAMDFDYVRGRAQGVARAYVRLVRKHPRLIGLWGNESVSIESCTRKLARGEVAQVELEAALGELARIDVGALRELRGEYAALADEIQERLQQHFPELNRSWWRAGYRVGLAEHGLRGFAELLEGGLEPWPIASACERVLLAWPRWSERESLERLFEVAAPLAKDGFAALLLRRDPQSDPPREAVLGALQDAYRRRFGEGGSLEVVLEEAALGTCELRRLGRSVQGLIALGGEPSDFLAALGCERLTSAAALASWRARYTGAPGSEAPLEVDLWARPARLDLSVIVPTRDRPRELLQLVEALARQDLDPARFEVLIVDDGSSVPVATLLDPSAHAFDLKVLAQPASGPAAARNRALAHARGRIAVFFNDDAVPAPSNLRRHIDAHALSEAPRAVIGAFRMLPRLVRDTLALFSETSNVLFAQPRMQAGVCYHGLALCTGNASIPRDVLLAAGGFDESLSYAGGEDSELGLRLEREHGLRPVYDPRIEAGHDHALDAEGLARRRRVVGWSAYHIQARHPGAGLFDVLDWQAFADEVEREAAERGALERRIARVCAQEDSGARPRGQSGEIPGLVGRLSELEFRHGLLLAQRGELPSTPAPRVDDPPAALPHAESGGMPLRSLLGAKDVAHEAHPSEA
jgi:glycosyltransferase involved in cell wall biosynthesis